MLSARDSLAKNRTLCQILRRAFGPRTNNPRTCHTLRRAFGQTIRGRATRCGVLSSRGRTIRGRATRCGFNRTTKSHRRKRRVAWTLDLKLPAVRTAGHWLVVTNEAAACTAVGSAETLDTGTWCGHFETIQYCTIILHQSLKRKFSCLPLTNNKKYIKKKSN